MYRPRLAAMTLVVVAAFLVAGGVAGEVERPRVVPVVQGLGQRTPHETVEAGGVRGKHVIRVIGGTG